MPREIITKTSADRRRGHSTGPKVKIGIDTLLEQSRHSPWPCPTGTTADP